MCILIFSIFGAHLGILEVPPFLGPIRLLAPTSYYAPRAIVFNAEPTPCLRIITFTCPLNGSTFGTSRERIYPRHRNLPGALALEDRLSISQLSYVRISIPLPISGRRIYSKTPPFSGVTHFIVCRATRRECR